MSIHLENQCKQVISEVLHCLNVRPVSRVKFIGSPQGNCVVTQSKSSGRFQSTIEIEGGTKICVLTSFSGIVVSGHLESGASDKVISSRLRNHLEREVLLFKVEVLPREIAP